MLEYFLQGGTMMWPLLALSIISLAVVIDRTRAFRLADVDTNALRSQVIESLQQGNLEAATEACEHRKGPVAAVLLVGINKYRTLKALGKDIAELEANVNKTMEDYAPHVVEALEKRLNLLVLVASLAPLLGMTGTVTGMIKSFTVLADADPAAIGAGIAEALITTAAGLLIAMPSVVFYNIYSKRVDRFVLSIEESAAELIDFITIASTAKPAAPAPGAVTADAVPASEAR